MTSDLLLRNARLVRDGSPAEPVDVLISDGTIVAIGSGLPDAAEVVDLEGRYLMNGLWDHHVHFQQWAVSRQHLDLSGTTSAREVADRVRDRLATNPPPAGTALFGYGFRDGLWPDAPLKSMLDEVSGDVPVALASGDLHCGWLNSAAIRKIGAVDRPSGLLRETEFVPVMQLQAAIAPSVVEELVADAARTAASRGIVGVVELQNARWTGDDGAAEGTDGRFAQHAYGVLSRSLSGSFRGCSRPARRTARDAGSADAAGVRSRDFQCDPCDRGSCEQAGPGRVREGRLWWDDRARAADRAGGLPPVPAARGGGERPAGARAGRSRCGGSALGGADGKGVRLRWVAGGRGRVAAGVGCAGGAAGSLVVDGGRRRPVGRRAGALASGARDPVADALDASTRGGRTPTAGAPADLVVLDADRTLSSAADLRTTQVHATLLAGRWTWRS